MDTSEQMDPSSEYPCRLVKAVRGCLHRGAPSDRSAQEQDSNHWRISTMDEIINHLIPSIFVDTSILDNKRIGESRKNTYEYSIRNPIPACDMEFILWISVNHIIMDPIILVFPAFYGMKKNISDLFHVP